MENRTPKTMLSVQVQTVRKNSEWWLNYAYHIGLLGSCIQHYQNSQPQSVPCNLLKGLRSFPKHLGKDLNLLSKFQRALRLPGNLKWEPRYHKIGSWDYKQPFWITEQTSKTIQDFAWLPQKIVSCHFGLPRPLKTMQKPPPEMEWKYEGDLRWRG